MAPKLSRTPAASLARNGHNLRTVVDRIVRTFDRATASDVERGARWYGDAEAIAASLAPMAGSLEHAAAVIAHLSPRTSWARNIAGATELVAGGPATYCLGANRDGARRALASTDPLATLNGPKVSRFARNILGDRDAVTVDVWAARVALGPRELDAEKVLTRAGVYDAIEHAYRLAAKRRGVDAATMQATTWVVARNGRAD